MRKRIPCPGRAISATAVLFLLSCVAHPASSETEPYIAYVYPAGAAAGSSCLVTVAGQGLRAASALLLSGDGIEASLVEYLGPSGPLTRTQEEDLKAWLAIAAKQARDGTSLSGLPPPPALPDRAEFRELGKRSVAELRALYERYLNRDNRPKPPMDEVAIFSLRLSPSARPGRRELRLVAGAALSNPVVFEVGLHPEYREPERFALFLSGPSSAKEAALVPPFTINGQVFPGEVDRFPIALAAGEEIDCKVSARSLIPFLADAVPGWIQPLIGITDGEGSELAWADDEGRNPDPVLRFRAPRAATYSLYLRDAIYRGRFDFVYRIEVTRAGPGRTAGATVPASAAATTGDTILAREWKPGPWTGSLDRPSVVEGLIGAPGEVDRYSFEAKAGEVLVAELLARRSGSPLDGLLALYDASGKLLATNDDSEDKEDGLASQHADPYLRLKMPSNGTFTLVVADTIGHGGTDYAYRLRLGLPREDFAVLTDRSAINLPASGAALFRVLAIRKDGWDGDIELVLVDPPEGLSLQGGTIPAGKESVGVTLSFVGKALAAPLRIRLEARAKIGKDLVVHPVSACDRMMQAFAYNHYVAAGGLYAGFLKGRGKGETASLDPSPPILIPAGGRLRVGFALPALSEAIRSSGGVTAVATRYELRLELVEPPAGITLSEARFEEKGLSFLLAADAGKAGFTDNLILRLTLLPLAVTAASPATPAASGVPGSAKSAKPIELGLAPAFRIVVTAR